MILAINTATSETSIAILDNRKVIDERVWHAERDEAQKTLPAIAVILKKNRLEVTELTGIMVVKGPGPFSGVRVGISIANTFAFALSLPIFIIDTFEYYRLRFPSEKSLLVFLSAGHAHHAVKGFGLKLENKIIGTIEDIMRELSFLKNVELNCVGEIATLVAEEISHHSRWNILSSEQLLSFGNALKKVEFLTLKADQQAIPEYLFPPSITTPRKPYRPIRNAGRPNGWA